MTKKETDWAAVGGAMRQLADALSAAAAEAIRFVANEQSQQFHIPPRLPKYPAISKFETGFPLISDRDFSREAPIDYEAYLSGWRGGIFRTPLSEVPRDWLPSLNAVTEAFRLLREYSPYDFDVPIEDDFHGRAKSLVQEVAVRYLHSNGTNLDKGRLSDISWTFIQRYAGIPLTLHLAVPIVLTHFEFDYFSLDCRHKIVRIPEAYQLARSQLYSTGSGVETLVAKAATHAFVGLDWSFVPTDDMEVSDVINSFPVEASDLIDRFFAALRLATGVNTGYAQVLYVHRRWAYYPKWDLPSISGRFFRRYPSQLDNYGWIKDDLPSIQRGDMAKVRAYFVSLENDQHPKIKHALRRLSAAITREDDDDAILDAAIGLELLLGDGNEALSYKLRMRVAALSKITNAGLDPNVLMEDVKALYSVRSKIVHQGVNPTSEVKKHQLSNDYVQPSPERQSAISILRFVLDTLIRNPNLRDPKVIDSSILL